MILDPSLFWLLISALSGFGIGCVLFFIYWILSYTSRKKELRTEMNRIVNQAKSQAERIKRTAQFQAKNFERKVKDKADLELRKEKKKIEHLQYQAEKKKQQLEEEWSKKTQELEEQIKNLDLQKDRTEHLKEQLKRDTQKAQDTLQKYQQAMEQATGWTREQARTEVKKNIEEELKKEIAPKLLQIENQLKADSEKKAKLMLSQALARFASEVSTERTTTTCPIKGSETKGKIIGREGRNIRALEAACGVDIIIDESQEIILISCFDAVRREVAVKSIERLLEEGRVHPARIEEVVEKTKRNIFASMSEEGKKVCFDMSIHNVQSAIIEVLGSLKYRSVEGFNSLKASVEVALIASFIAGEIGFDQKTTRRAGLLHAIGLGLNHRLEGSMAKAGADFLRKHGENETIYQAVRCHNGECQAESVLDHIIQVSYNLFRERPGAKRENIENYIKRLKDMESIANSFDGIIRSFAIQTGKEIRVLVDSGKVTDEQAFMLNRDIAEKIDKEMNTAGQLTVSVIRECRIVEQAR